MYGSNMFGIPQIETLTSKNYTLWSSIREALIKSKHLFVIIENYESILTKMILIV